ncbi:MAG TPA: tripartite tricarboxylate transporter substrate-binding protein, partial [Burkholderiaceae bacterium]|nr:tripartite tricarboxylate transporter substrate-binding protein [Burkholderiaceae bacterium]
MHIIDSTRNAAMRRRAVSALFLAAGVCMLPSAQAQQPWPSKTVTLLVGVPAGGALDPFARALADQLGKVTGGTFVVDNRPGANGNVSAEAALKAPADGHTLWIGT